EKLAHVGGRELERAHEGPKQRLVGTLLHERGERLPAQRVALGVGRQDLVQQDVEHLEDLAGIDVAGGGDRARFRGASPRRGAGALFPSMALPIFSRTLAVLADAPTSGLRLTWLGHSTVLVEIDGVRLLTDPVWGARASPFSFAGPKRFHPPPVPLSSLPPID